MVERQVRRSSTALSPPRRGVRVACRGTHEFGLSPMLIWSHLVVNIHTFEAGLMAFNKLLAVGVTKGFLGENYVLLHERLFQDSNGTVKLNRLFI